MTLFETYHVHILKPVALEWTEDQQGGSHEIVRDDDFCGLLELVTTLYLRQRAKVNPRAADLVAGARNDYDHTLVGYDRPFKTAALYELRPLLRRMLEDLDSREATREIDVDYARQARRSLVVDFVEPEGDAGQPAATGAEPEAELDAVELHDDNQ